MATWPEVRVLKPGFPLGTDGLRKAFVVAFDPGVTSGWCVLRVDLAALLSDGFRAVALGDPDPARFTWSAGSFRGPDSFQAEQMMALVRGTWMHGEGVFDDGAEGDLFVVVVEDFVLRVMSTDRDLLSPVRVSAAFGALSWRAPFPVIRPSSSDALSVTTDARLRALNLWSGVAGKDGEHQRDATKHAVLAARKLVDSSYRAQLIARSPWLCGGD